MPILRAFIRNVCCLEEESERRAIFSTLTSDCCSETSSLLPSCSLVCFLLTLPFATIFSFETLKISGQDSLKHWSYNPILLVLANMATVQSPKYVPLMPDLTSTFSTAPDIIPSAAPRCAVNAFASKVLVCRAAVLPWLASVIFGIPAFVLLIVGDQRRRYYGAHLAGFPLTFIAISLLADTFTAAYHAAKNVFRVEWREPAWRDHAETIHHLSMLCAGWQFHVFEAVMIVFGAFLVICETYLNGELTAGVVLSFLLS